MPSIQKTTDAVAGARARRLARAALSAAALMCCGAANALLTINVGGVAITDNDANDTNNAVGIIEFNQTLAAFSATGKLYNLRPGAAGGGAAVNRLVLTDLTVQALVGKVVNNGTISFADTFAGVFPNATLVHLDGRYFHGGGNIVGADVILTGVADNLAVGDTALGNVDPLAVGGAATPQPFTYALGKTADTRGNLGGNTRITGIGGTLTFSLNPIDGFILPNSAEIAVSDSSSLIEAVPEPSTWLLFGFGLAAVAFKTARRRS